MNGGNASGLLSMQDIDGGLIGGASLKPEDFLQICNFRCSNYLMKRIEII